MSDEVALYREFARQCVELAQQREMAPHSSLLIAMATEWVEHADREIENGAKLRQVPECEDHGLDCRRLSRAVLGVGLNGSCGRARRGN
jgi:hypothetical protein